MDTEDMDDTRIFGMTHKEFDALPESEKERLLPKLKLPGDFLHELETEEQEDAESYDWCRSGW
jgi:hypothetical protein